ncbi:hypothetical protein BDZ89DRAFT_1141061 [Hymenopellis radicata]|nr:hypothetical protein BDZ89DRAFT_1141061 [Hymenopellis radicata]
MSWFTRKLRSGKEFNGQTAQCVELLRAAQTFKLKNSLRIAEDLTVTYLMSPDERCAPSPPLPARMSPSPCPTTPLPTHPPNSPQPKRKDPPEDCEQDA